jgi:hypothetical protein
MNLLKFIIVLNFLTCIGASVAYIYISEEVQDFLVSPDMASYMEHEGTGLVFTEFDME